MKSITPHVPWLGGPGTILPSAIESIFSWSLCLSCLSISGYHYYKSILVTPMVTKVCAWARSMMRHRVLCNYPTVDENRNVPPSTTAHTTAHKDRTVDFSVPFLRYWIPLTTHSRSELQRINPVKAYERLVEVLTILAQRASTSVDDKDFLLRVCRTNMICRRLASLAMRPYETSKKHYTMLYLDNENRPIISALALLWAELLKLQIPSSMDEFYEFHISIVIPLYNENSAYIEKQLQLNLQHCSNPSAVEVIIVNASSEHEDLSNIVDNHEQLRENNKNLGNDGKAWGRIRILSYLQGGGRGPTLNYGAQSATGRILTFCHLDTIMPVQWDEKIKSTLSIGMNLGDAQQRDTKDHNILSNACAFSFGINTTVKGPGGKMTLVQPFPPGLRAVEFTANMRTHLFSLPYGDQVISLHRTAFEVLGGFPDQCLMEDYELVGLLRKRASMLRYFEPKRTESKVNKLHDSWYNERLRIIEGEPALCSPRRWQKFGVLYVTYMNSKFVNMYASGLHSDDLYRLYYREEPPSRQYDISPWELELDAFLKEARLS